mgnify:CR=1 FL=1
MLNTAGSADFGCPGMPSGVLCKTPAAVYKSTHQDPEPTAFDTPIGVSVGQVQSQQEAALSAPLRTAAGNQVQSQVQSGPRPVREPARVARIWVAPWVDKQDNLHLAQIHYTEVKPRTWTVGKPEVSAGGAYVIPHRAFDKIPVPVEPKAEPVEAARIQPGNNDAAREAANLVAPPN